MKTRTVITMVAGVMFEGRQDILEAMSGNEPCRLIPDPTNKYDKNAVGVHVAMADGTIKQVGFLPRDLAAMVAPRIAGEQVMCVIREIVGGFEKLDGTMASLGLRILVEYPDDEDRQA